MERYLQLSVHQLVDFLLRTGDIDNRVFNRNTMNEGSRIHSFYQSQQNSESYLSEYPLKANITKNEINIQLEGRADGIIKRKDGSYLIDEIKTTVMDLEEFYQENEEWHLGQAKCYAFMFARERELEEIGIKLTYVRQGKEKEKSVKYFNFTYLDLEQYIMSLLDEYLEFYNIIFRKTAERNTSIIDLQFPFPNFRPGQKQIAKYCYAVAKNGGVLFCEAPTGIGKTMSTLYPFVKALADDEEGRIFYLTAKSSGKDNAYRACEILKAQGLNLTEIVVTAKDKICFCKGKACNPEECPYAKGYYNKIQTILTYAIVNYTSFDAETIEQIAYENQVCPFELELDLSLFADVIICDYNYMFHPISYMKRYFDEDATHYLALIDEAHNLVDRSRDMHSSSLSYKKLKTARASVKHVKLAKMKTALSKMNKLFTEFEDEYKDDGNYIVSDFSDATYKVLNSFYNSMQDVIKDDSKLVTKEVMDFYLDVNQFLKISELINDRYLNYIELKDEEISLNLYCMDAAPFLRKTLQNIRASVFFSATLAPLQYYMDTLGGNSTTDPSVVLPSPFPRENLKIMIAPRVSIKYKDRENSYEQVGKYIESFVSGKIGNYFVFVPSYDYLDKLTSNYDFSKYNIYTQNREMREQDKAEFLLNFQNNPEITSIGFVVIGGAFGEGIDLVSDRLIGAVIVGIGLPRINFVSDQIKDYYNSCDMPGYAYAYLNPGMNKVMQAVGRVIRSETDRGAVLLIDERYLNRNYKELFKEDWKDYEVVFSPEEVKEEIKNFFN